MDFFGLVEAIQDNNKINCGTWSDWDSCAHAEEAYGTLTCDYVDVVRQFIDVLIRDNGENLELFENAIDCLVYGSVFSRKNK